MSKTQNHLKEYSEEKFVYNIHTKIAFQNAKKYI